MMVEAIVFFYLGGVICSMSGDVRAIKYHGWPLHWGWAVFASFWCAIFWPYFSFWKAVR